MKLRDGAASSDGGRQALCQRIEAGFTIVELMIATLVFSVVLLVLTAGMMQIGHTFFKGLVSSRTQEVARSIADDVGQTIQFAGGDIVDSSNTSMDNGAINGSTIHGICLGSRRYSYVLDQQLTNTGPSPHRLVVDTASSGCSNGPGGIKARAATGSDSLADPLSGGGQELLGANMRLTKFSVTPVSSSENLYNIVIRVVYGGDDLLCSPSVAGDCSSTAPSSSLNDPDITCKDTQAGTQYCAVSEISTTVQKRLK